MQKGNSLIISLTLVMVLTTMCATLVMISNSYVISYKITRKILTSKYVAKTGLAIAITAINKYDQVNEIQGNLNNLESVIVKLSEKDIWEALVENQSEKGKQNRYRYGHTYKNRNIPIKNRQSFEYKVLIERYGQGYIASSYGIFENKVCLIKGYIFKQEILKCKGIFGVKSLEFEGWGGMDSYTSLSGVYSKTNQEKKALIGSDLAISLSNLFTIYGDMKLGKNGRINTPSNIHGNITYEEKSIVDTLDRNWLSEETEQFSKEQRILKAQTVHFDKVYLESNLTISGKNIIYCHGDFIATQKSCLSFQKEATLTVYVGGNFIFDGGTDFSHHKGLQFQIISISNDKTIEPSNPRKNEFGGWSIKITPTTDFKGFIYAPMTNVCLKTNKHFMGAITGYRVHIISDPENKDIINIHYDRAIETENQAKNYVYKLKAIEKIIYVH